MRVCVYGLGAIGGLIAGRLAASGAPVCAVARGSTLDAVRQHGLRLVDASGAAAPLHLPVSDSPAALGPQDLVIVAVKTTGLAAVARDIGPLLGPETSVVWAMNGVPWWFFHGLAGAPPALQLRSVDPDGALARAIAVERILGCMVQISAACPEPGVVRIQSDGRLMIGEPTGGAGTPRAMGTIELLRKAGFLTQGSEVIQMDIWFKLWANMTFNPISAITGVTVDRILDEPLTRDFVSRCMMEAREVGARIGLPITATPEERHALTRRAGAIRTSMLQDAEAGKPLEIDALIGAVVEIAGQLAIPTPNIDALLGLTRLRARRLGLYPDRG